jgi:indole-3-glycerol phosphate synthase
MTILDEIVKNKKKELEFMQSLNPLKELIGEKHFSRDTISLKESLLDTNKTGIIAEFKRKSPSKGIINDKASVIEVTRGYGREGASAISVLTDNKFFGGTSGDLLAAREINDLPLLRKEFIISEYQVIESKALGADAILLIAAILSREAISALALLAHSLQLEVLLEIHGEDELVKINENIDIIGINNRNLKTFEVNAETSLKLIKRIPSEFLKISESGISSPVVIWELREAGFKGFLIGERFMSSEDPVREFSSFVKVISSGHVKD